MLSVLAQAFGQPLGIAVVIGLLGHFDQAPVQALDARAVSLGREIGTLPQADPVPHHSPQLLCERLPGVRLVVLVHLLQLAQQMHQAALVVADGQRVVRRPEVPDPDPVECIEEELLQRRTAATAIDQPGLRRVCRWQLMMSTITLVRQRCRGLPQSGQTATQCSSLRSISTGGLRQ